MNDDHHDDAPGGDPIAERVLAALEEGRLGTPAGPRAGGETRDELLERLYTETLGLVACELPVRPPAPGARERLLEAVRARRAAPPAGDRGEPQPVVAGSANEGGSRPRLATFPSRPVAVPPAAALAAAPEAAAGSAPGAAAQVPAARAALPGWMLALAASLLLAVLALGAFSGWLYARLGHQQAQLAALQAELHQAERRADLLSAHQGDLERRRLDLASQLALITTPGVEVCPLHPVGERPPYPQARGLLFLSNVREEWYVRLSGLEPAPRGQVYRLWFLMGDERPVDAGLLVPGPDEAIALSGTEMPDPGRMTGALVTLEPEGRPARRPAGPQVLFGDEKMLMI